MYTVTMREARQAAIEQVLQTSVVTTQQQLRDALKRAGHAVDQSTLSRDLQELGVRKVAGRYQRTDVAKSDGSQRLDYAAAVRSFVVCGPNLIVLRTAVGQAQPVALVIDAKKDPAIVATLAGDDTIFVATRNRRTQTVALRRLTTWFGDKREP